MYTKFNVVVNASYGIFDLLGQEDRGVGGHVPESHRQPKINRDVDAHKTKPAVKDRQGVLCQR